MNSKRDFDRAVDQWLDDGSDATPPEVIDAVLLAVRSTPQERRSWWPAWRTNRMTTYAKSIAAAAAVLLVVIVGYQFLPAGSGSGGSRPTQSSLPAPIVGAAANGVIALAKDGDIVVADRPGGDVRPLVAGPESDYNPTFSPDGTRLAFERATDLGPVRMGVLMIADADGANVVQLTGEPLETYGSPWSFAPDGRSLMTLARFDGAYRVVVRPVDPAAALAVLDIRLPDSPMDVELPSFHPTNPQEILVVAQPVPDGPRGLYVYDLATGRIRTIVEPADGYVRDIAWLPDGEHITYNLGFDRHVVAADGSGDDAFDALRGRVFSPYANDGSRVFSPFSNDGSRIVVQGGGDGGGDGEADPWAMIVPINGDGEPVVLACPPRTDIECPMHGRSWIWSPDDSMLIGISLDTSSSGEPLGEAYLLVDAHTGQVTELDWRDGGRPAWQRVAP